jgi:hypothetical protein
MPDFSIRRHSAQSARNERRADHPGGKLLEKCAAFDQRGTGERHGELVKKVWNLDKSDDWGFRDFRFSIARFSMSRGVRARLWVFSSAEIFQFSVRPHDHPLTQLAATLPIENRAIENRKFPAYFNGRATMIPASVWKW